MDFEGDALLQDSPDGGELRLEDGLFSCDKTAGTAAYLSLFGGNADDGGFLPDGAAWWGNSIGGADEAMTSRFQNFVTGRPMTAKNLALAEDAARQDLQWLLDGGIAVSAAVSGRIEAQGRARFEIEISLAEGGELKREYEVLWGRE